MPQDDGRHLLDGRMNIKHGERMGAAGFITQAMKEGTRINEGEDGCHTKIMNIAFDPNYENGYFVSNQITGKGDKPLINVYFWNGEIHINLNPIDGNNIEGWTMIFPQEAFYR